MLLFVIVHLHLNDKLIVYGVETKQCGDAFLRQTASVCRYQNATPFCVKCSGVILSYFTLV